MGGTPRPGGGEDHFRLGAGPNPHQSQVGGRGEHHAHLVGAGEDETGPEGVWGAHRRLGQNRGGRTRPPRAREPHEHHGETNR